MLLEALARRLGQEQADLTPALLAQIFLLYEILGNPDSPRAPVVATSIAALGMTGFRRAFGLSAVEQFKRLRSRPGTALDELQRGPSQEFGVIMRSRALVVLSKPQTEAQLVAYGRTLAAVSVTFGSRAGFETVGEASGARFKTFTRMVRVQEPRAHSALEQKTIPVGQNWLIDGYSVPRPADASLPLSSRLWCKHTNIFSP